jgi:hypothetical protein
MRVEVILIASILAVAILIGYSAVGTSGDVRRIKDMAPDVIESRNWDIMRYEGWQNGSWANHGGKVWYHVRNSDDHRIQYRVYVTYWDKELHFTYGEPENLNRINLDIVKEPNQ